MDELGWDSCDVVLVTGDAYIDHPSFGMALIGRLLESHGFRVGILDQPDWRDADAFTALGRPNVMWGVTAGNMDSMVNRYTSDKKVRSDDAYSPDGAAGLRPDRRVIVYAQTLPRGVRRRAARDRRHRGEPAPDRALRLLERQGPPLGARRHARRPAGLRQRRARDRRDRASPRRRRRRRATIRICAAPRSSARATASRRSTRRRSTSPAAIDPPPDPYAMEERAAAEGAACTTGEAAPAHLIQLKPKQVVARAASDPDAELRAGHRRSDPLRARVARSSTSRRTPATRARSSSATATPTSGSTRRRFR